MNQSLTRKFAPTRVILHCSATPDFPIESPLLDSVGVEDIDAWHKARGWKGCAYHKVVMRSGLISNGRSEAEMGAHCFGQNNDSLGICLVGTDKFLPNQYRSMLHLFFYFRDKYGIEVDAWWTHNFYTTKKTCPNLTTEWLRSWLRKQSPMPAKT